MFARLAEHYRTVVADLVMSLRALADGLQRQGLAATCYVCGDELQGQGASFVADLGDGHMVRFLVSDYGISWVESRNGHELVKLEGQWREALAQRQGLQALLGLRGDPPQVLYQLEQWLGPVALLESLAATLAAVAPAAQRHGVRLQLDPTFQPHFALYDGLVIKLVCCGAEAPVAIASGGRYDGLVGRFCSDPAQAAGGGFGFDLEAVRELLDGQVPAPDSIKPMLVAYADPSQLARALDALEALHHQGTAAELLSDPIGSEAEAQLVAATRGCQGLHWLSP